MLPFSTENGMTGYIPSNDFGIFQLPQFGELFGNSLGLSTRFQNSDPTSYVDYSLNSLAQILKPQSNIPVPSSPNYGQGFELPNVLQNLPPLIAPQYPSGSFFQTPSNAFFQNPSEATIQGRIGAGNPPLTPSEYERIIRTAPRGEAGTSIDVNVNTQDPCQGQGRNIFGGCGPIIGTKPMISDGQGSGSKRVVGDDPTKSGDKAQSVSDWFKTLPQGAGIFLIAIAIIVLILLFARGK